MFQTTKCSVEGCKNPAVSLRTQCFSHLEDKDAYFLELKKLFAGGGTFSGLTLPFVDFRSFNLEKKAFLLCNFSRAGFYDLRLTESSFRMCFFDSCRFEGCSAERLDVMNSVFAGASIERCTFEGSTFLQANFNNLLTCKDVSFKASDLYNSRFIGAFLERVDFTDCNLKNVDFCHSVRTEVNFKYSNKEDALFEYREEL